MHFTLRFFRTVFGAGISTGNFRDGDISKMLGHIFAEAFEQAFFFIVPDDSLLSFNGLLIFGITHIKDLQESSEVILYLLNAETLTFLHEFMDMPFFRSMQRFANDTQSVASQVVCTSAVF